MEFLRASPLIPRGPFTTSAQWVNARLADAREKLAEQAGTCKDGDGVEFVQGLLSVADRLVRLIPATFPPTQGLQRERMTLFLHDMHRGNILIDEDDKLAAVIDFEMVSTAPPWQACRIPKLLVPKLGRRFPPTKAMYPVDGDNTPQEIEDGTSRHYWDHLIEYEQGVLRELFVREMGHLRPEWTEWFKQGQTKREFLMLVDSVIWGSISNKDEYTWLDALEKGEPTAGILVEENDDEDDESEGAYSWWVIHFLYFSLSSKVLADLPR